MTEDKVRKMLKPELVNAANKLQEMFTGRLTIVADGLGKFIDKERQARVETDGKVSTLANSLSSLQKAADESKSSTDDISSFRKAVDEAKADQETWNNYTSNQIHEYGREVEGHRNSLSTINSQVEELRDQLRRGYEGHQMQLMHLSSWMNTFNTRRMYNEIVAHLNAAQPTGANLNAQLRTLSERMDGLENREDEGGVKKRKALNGNAVVVNNSRRVERDVAVEPTRIPSGPSLVLIGRSPNRRPEGCQRFFRSRAASGWFEVGRGIRLLDRQRNSQQTDDLAKQLIRAHHTQADRFKAKKKEMIQVANDKTEPNGWVNRVGRDARLSRLDPDRLRKSARGIQEDEAAARDVQQFRSCLGPGARATALPMKVGQPALFEVERKEANVKPNRPFDV
ncbi:hypothetical protein AUP68_14028 [Ilyonectria robusta]